MTKKELWNKFMKTGRITDYLAYQRARDDTMPQPNAFSEELAEEFVQNFDDDFPAMEPRESTVDAEEYFDEDDTH